MVEKLARLAALALVGAGIACTALGCGGSSGGAGGTGTDSSGTSPAARGALTMAVKWPVQRAAGTASRLIPDDSRSIQVQLTTPSGGPSIASACLARPIGTGGAVTPSSSYTFTNVPAGALQVTASAFPDDACSETPAQAAGSAAVTVQPGVTQSVTVTMAGTVASVSAIPPTATLPVGGSSSVTLTASALDSQNETVLTAPGDWTWSCSPASAVTPSSGAGPLATLTGVQSGQTVTCTFTCTQAPGAAPVTGSATVTVGPTPTPTPSGSPSPASSYTLTTLVSFNGYNGCEGFDGFSPGAALIMDGQGNLYGTTISGGSSYTGGENGYGTIFEWRPSTGLTTLASFNQANGWGPDGGLLRDTDGNLYGTTFGAGDGGTLFEWTAASGISTLASFPGIDAGSLAGLTTDGAGDFYGTTYFGYGSVFKYNASSGLTTLAAFQSGGPSSPDGSLLLDSQGDLVGTTLGGGYNGTIFKFNPQSSAVTTLADFDDTDGAGPTGNLATDGKGSYYGTTTTGGQYGLGTIYQWSATSGLDTLASFDGTNGATPYGGVVRDSFGNLYGTTYNGGPGYTGPSSAGYGTVFEWSAATGEIQTIATFNGANGSGPTACLLADGQGDFYGTTVWGGSTGYGTIFELTPVGASGAARGRAASTVGRP